MTVPAVPATECPHDLGTPVGEREWDAELESYKHRKWRCTGCGRIEVYGADGWMDET